MAVSMERLRELADRLPPKSPQREYTLAFTDHGIPPIYARYMSDEDLRQAIHTDRITFRHREVTVEGVRCSAWFYHDLLVKVCV